MEHIEKIVLFSMSMHPDAHHSPTTNLLIKLRKANAAASSDVGHCVNSRIFQRQYAQRCRGYSDPFKTGIARSAGPTAAR
jgi:hypothetical protein